MNTIGAVMASEINETPQVFSRLGSNLDQFAAVKNLLVERKISAVQILARGTSDNAAHFLKYLIEVKMGLPVGLTSPSAISIYQSPMRYEGVLVIALSQSGQSPDLVGFAQAALLANATVISMTNDSDSPLAKISNLHFPLLAGPELAVAATKSYSAELLVSYLLVSTWMSSTFNTQEIVQESQKLVDNTHLVDDAIASCDRSSGIVFMGRGFGYPNAREAALKVQETAKISVQGFSTADYLHGPISSLAPDSQLFIVAPYHQPQSLISEAVARIRTVVPRIYWIGSGGTPESNDIVIEGSQCADEVSSSIVDAVALQRFSLEFSRKCGLDPDAPAGLTKVTLTH